MKGHCYEVCFLVLKQSYLRDTPHIMLCHGIVRQLPRPPRCVVCHGKMVNENNQVWRCTNDPAHVTEPYLFGPWMGHAWLEEWELDPTTKQFRWIVRDSIDFADGKYDKELYYKIGQINPKQVRTYTWQQARRLYQERQSFGPWDETIALAAHRREDY